MPRLAREKILEVIHEYHPDSLSSLSRILRSKGMEFEDAELLSIVRGFEAEGELVRSDGTKSVLFRAFLTDVSRSWWLYAVIIVSLLESVIVAANFQSPIFLVFRMILGVLLLAFTPGYAATKALFPAEDFPLLERLLLSIFLSLITSIGLGTVLGAFLVFTAESSTLLIGIGTIFIGVVGAYRACLDPSRSMTGLRKSIVHRRSAE